MVERGLKMPTCRAVPRMEGGVFFKEVRMEGARGSGGPASHTRTFPDLVDRDILASTYFVNNVNNKKDPC